jgi:CBS domain-containing protein
MRPAAELTPDTEIGAAIAKLKSEPLDAWPVTDNAGFRAMVRGTDLEKAASGGAAGRRVADVLDQSIDHDHEGPEFPHVHPDHSLSLALERMGSSGLNVLPVVSRANVRQLLGIVVLDDILRAYGVAKASNGNEGNGYGGEAQSNPI